MHNTVNTVYCPNKFTYLKIDLEKRLVYNCHKAYPHQITSTWLKENPGKIFNTDKMITERKEMLNGIRNSSCSYQCYKAEDKGALSLRLHVLNTDNRHYTNSLAQVETLDLMLNTDCNLSCVYCSGMFSSAHRKEVQKFGPYSNMQKNWSDVYDRISQKEKNNSIFFQLFLKEVASMTNLKTLIITGGEPLLSNHLDLIIDKLDKNKVNIRIVTGLGVSEHRFNNMIEKIKNYKNLLISISAEGLDQHFEFMRFGSKFQTFKKYLGILENENINYDFICTVSNLGMFGLYNFYKKYQQHPLIFNLLSYPTFLQKHILDNESKKMLIEQWSKHNDNFSHSVLKGLEYQPSDNDRLKLKTFLKELSTRRNISLNIFPTSFLKWIDAV